MFILVVTTFIILGSLLIFILKRKRPMLATVYLFPAFLITYVLSFLVREPDPIVVTILMLLFEGFFLAIGVFFIIFLLSSYEDDSDDDDDWRDDDDDDDKPDAPGSCDLWDDFEKSRPVDLV
jgi:predicted membrane channel-forming protein YqfA (hemolysin III family)